jgi:hypothetical protein
MGSLLLLDEEKGRRRALNSAKVRRQLLKEADEATL